MHNLATKPPLTVAIMVLAGLAAACSGDDSSDEAEPTEATSTEETLDEGSDQSEDEAATTTGDASTTAVETPDEAELDEIVDRFDDVEAKITYRLDDGTEMTLVQQPPNRAYLTPQGGVYALGDEVVFCNLEGGAQCFRIPGAEGAAAGLEASGFLGPFATVAALFDLARLPGISDAGSRSIAGRTARCIDYDPQAVAEAAGVTDVDGTICIDERDGYLLLYEATDQAGVTTSIEAVEVGQPQASDFDLPAEPQSFDLPQTQGGG